MMERKLFIQREALKIEISNSTLQDDEIDVLKLKIKDIEDKMADVKAAENFKIVEENLKHLADEKDNLNCIKMWQLKKKIGTQKYEVPAAKKNKKGELITEQSKLKNL